MPTLEIILGVAGLASWALGFPAARVLARHGVIDRPNDRSSPSRPTVRGGGEALVSVVALAGACQGWQAREGSIPFALTIAMLALAVVSFVDDLRSLPAGWRFGCHLAAAVARRARWSWSWKTIWVRNSRPCRLPLT